MLYALYELLCELRSDGYKYYVSFTNGIVTVKVPRQEVEFVWDKNRQDWNDYTL